jgi:polysaccharide biosynthesis transport protein
MENPQDSKLHFLDYWRVIRVRLGLVILVFLLVVIAAGVTTYLLPRKYKSFATIELEPDMTPVRIFENEAPRQTANDPKFTQTQFQIIMRKGVLYPVVDRLDLRKKWGSNTEPLPREVGVSEFGVIGRLLPRGLVLKDADGRHVRFYFDRCKRLVFPRQ